MAVAVQHHPPPCTVTIPKTCTDQPWNGFQDSARIQNQMSMCLQPPKPLILVVRPIYTKSSYIGVVRI